MAGARVEIAGVSKTFDRGLSPFKALDSFDLEIRQGEFLSIVGPSGCGKSTLLRCVAGLDCPSEGRIAIDGRDIKGPPDRLGVVFQNDALADWLTVLDNVLLIAGFRSRSDRRELKSRAISLLERFGLKGFETRRPFELSGGMRQRAAICRALVGDPALLLMDEPFGALDAMTRDQLNVELQRIWMAAGKTVLFITHGIAEAVFLSDRVAVMSRNPGRLIETIEIDIPRPRHLSVRETAEFSGYVAKIRTLFLSLGILKDV